MIKTVLKIDGMKCPMCEAHMNEAIKAGFDVAEVSSSHKKGETVIISEGEPDSAKLKAAVEEQGFSFLGVSSEPYNK